MLSFEDKNDDARPIAIIKGGKYNNKIIYISGLFTGAENSNIIDNNPLDIMEDIYELINKKKLTKEQMMTTKNILARGLNNTENIEIIKNLIDEVREKCREISTKEFKIFDEGIIQALPNFNKTERIYIAGATECGKSYYAKTYLTQLIKIHKNKKIYIFSDVDEDEELDNLPNIIRFKLGEELLDREPIKVEKFKDSICVFDDIDSIQNPKILKYVQLLRDSILRRGRHDNISAIITSHLLTNYKDTRIILNEANNITFFPHSGSQANIKYLLKKYIGLSNIQIDKIMVLPSRWVSICKNSPQYLIYEKGIYIL